MGRAVERVLPSKNFNFVPLKEPLRDALCTPRMGGHDIWITRTAAPHSSQGTATIGMDKLGRGKGNNDRMERLVTRVAECTSQITLICRT